MGKWDKEIIELLPETVKVYASAGAGYDWVDTQALADRGTQPYPFTFPKLPPFVHVLSTDKAEFFKSNIFTRYIVLQCSWCIH